MVNKKELKSILESNAPDMDMVVFKDSRLLEFLVSMNNTHVHEETQVLSEYVIGNILRRYFVGSYISVVGNSIKVNNEIVFTFEYPSTA